MKLRPTLGAIAVAGALTLGAAAPAVAQESAGDPPSPACRAARHGLHDLRVVNRHLRREIRRVEAAIERALQNGNDERAARLQDRLDRLESKQDRLHDRIEAAIERVRERCGTTDAAA